MHILREQGLDAGAGPGGDSDAGDAGEHGQEGGFGQFEAEDLALGSPEGGADGELALLAGGARDHESGDIGAADEHQESNHAKEGEQHGLGLAAQLMAEAVDDGAGVGVGVGVLLFEALRDAAHFSAGLFEGDAGLEAADHLEEVGAAAGALLGVPGERREKLGFPAGDLEAWGHDADNGVGRAVERDGLSDDGGIAAEAVAPETVAEDDDGGGAGVVFLFIEDPAEEGLDAEQGEHVSGALHAIEADRLAIAGKGVGPAAEGGHVAEGIGLGLPVRVVGGGRGVFGEAPGGGVLPDADELPRLGVGQGPEHDGVHDAEHSGGGADAEAEGEDGDERESGAFAEGPGGEQQIVEHD